MNFVFYKEIRKIKQETELENTECVQMSILSAEVADAAWAAALGMGTAQRQGSAGKLGPAAPEANVSRQLQQPW